MNKNEFKVLWKESFIKIFLHSIILLTFLFINNLFIIVYQLIMKILFIIKIFFRIYSFLIKSRRITNYFNYLNIHYKITNKLFINYLISFIYY